MTVSLFITNSWNTWNPLTWFISLFCSLPWALVRFARQNASLIKAIAEKQPPSAGTAKAILACLLCTLIAWGKQRIQNSYVTEAMVTKAPVPWSTHSTLIFISVTRQFQWIALKYYTPKLNSSVLSRQKVPGIKKQKQGLRKGRLLTDKPLLT